MKLKKILVSAFVIMAIITLVQCSKTENDNTTYETDAIASKTSSSSLIAWVIFCNNNSSYLSINDNGFTCDDSNNSSLVAVPYGDSLNTQNHDLVGLAQSDSLLSLYGAHMEGVDSILEYRHGVTDYKILNISIGGSSTAGGFIGYLIGDNNSDFVKSIYYQTDGPDLPGYFVECVGQGCIGGEQECDTQLVILHGSDTYAYECPCQSDVCSLSVIPATVGRN